MLLGLKFPRVRERNRHAREYGTVIERDHVFDAPVKNRGLSEERAHLQVGEGFSVNFELANKKNATTTVMASYYLLVRRMLCGFTAAKH